MLRCKECDAVLKIPNDAISGEIIGCKDCDTEYELEFDKEQILLKAAPKKGEDWGE